MSTERTPPAHTSAANAIALLFGLLAFGLCWVPLVGVLAFPLGTVALVTALVGIRRTYRHDYGGRSLAIAGLVTGAIGLMVATYLLVVFLRGFYGPAWQGDWNDVRRLFQTQPR